MRKPVLFLLSALIAAVALFVVRHFEVRWGDSLEVRPRATPWGPSLTGQRSSTSQDPAAMPTRQTTQRVAPGARPALRVASFCLEPWNIQRMQRAADLDRLAEVVERFDVISLHGIRLEGPRPLVPLLDRLAQRGFACDAIDGPVHGASGDRHRFVVLFNTRTVESGRYDTYTLPSQRAGFRYAPLVTCFRALGPPADQAFTFSLASIYIDPDQSDREIALLAPLVAEIQGDGRGEDDVLLVGTMQRNGAEMLQVWNTQRVEPLLREPVPALMTRTDRRGQSDNLVIDTWATTEFTGRCGVFDLTREFNLRLEQAQQFSELMPVWAEFQLREAEAVPVH